MDPFHFLYAKSVIVETFSLRTDVLIWGSLRRLGVKLAIGKSTKNLEII